MDTVGKIVIWGLVGIIAAKLTIDSALYVAENVREIQREKRQIEFVQEQAAKREQNKRAKQERINKIYNGCKKLILDSYAGQIGYKKICNCTVECVLKSDKEKIQLLNDADVNITEERVQYCFSMCNGTMGQVY